jgi:hypothetical protein
MLSNGNMLTPTIINNIKMIRMEKEEGRYLRVRFKELELILH